MILVIAQDCNNLRKFEPYLTAEGEAKQVLLDAARRFILYEQGLKRSQEHIRTVQEIKNEAAKLEDGWYLVYPEENDDSIEAYRIEPKVHYGFGSSIFGADMINTPIRLKRFSAHSLKGIVEEKKSLPLSPTISNASPVTTSSTVSPSTDNASTTSAVSTDEIKNTNINTTSDETPNIRSFIRPSSSPRSLNFEKVRLEIIEKLKKRKMIV